MAWFEAHMATNDCAYFLRRIQQEQEAARAATCTQARERHEELAQAYRLRFQIDALISKINLSPVEQASRPLALSD